MYSSCEKEKTSKRRYNTTFIYRKIMKRIFLQNARKFSTYLITSENLILLLFIVNIFFLFQRGMQIKRYYSPQHYSCLRSKLRLVFSNYSTKYLKIVFVTMPKRPKSILSSNINYVFSHK